MREKTNLTLHKNVKELGQRLAEARGLSLSELVEKLIEEESRASAARIREDVQSGFVEQLSGLRKDIAEMKALYRQKKK